ITAYLIGSIPFGLILTSLFTSVDIRKNGSRNIGATNVKRLAGKKLGLITLVADMLKGAIPVYFGSSVLLNYDATWGRIGLSMVAFSAFLGHLYPVYMKFKGGGKGVATAAGCFFVLSPMASFTALLIFILFVCCFNRVSVGSLAATAVLPPAVWKFSGSLIMTEFAVIIGILIYYRHRENIKRLLAGSEPVM
ncbi:MAG: glycerol-3-phosphate 1-O-acyltransferase PlsY, partial [Deltaproteobacteria bacterium]|nr:glycerol-3-phosphate 1-O-acyltransferase PlsY [Deltaproteobacteria bacterium]